MSGKENPPDLLEAAKRFLNRVANAPDTATFSADALRIINESANDFQDAIAAEEKRRAEGVGSPPIVHIHHHAAPDPLAITKHYERKRERDEMERKRKKMIPDPDRAS